MDKYIDGHLVEIYLNEAMSGPVAQNAELLTTLPGDPETDVRVVRGEVRLRHLDETGMDWDSKVYYEASDILFVAKCIKLLNEEVRKCEDRQVPRERTSVDDFFDEVSAKLAQSAYEGQE